MTSFVTAFSEAHEFKDNFIGLSWPSIVTIYGTPKSGKTHFLLNLLGKIKHNFDEIVCYLGAKDSTQRFLDLVEKDKPPVIKILYEYNESDLRNYYNKLENKQMELIKAKKKPKNVLIVADDILTFPGFMKSNRNKPSILEQISANYRHINLSMIITSQRYMQVIPSLRSLNFKHMIVCSLGKSDIQKISEEHENMYFDKNEIQDIFFNIRKNGIGHLMLIDNDAYDKDRMKHILPDYTVSKIQSSKEI
jgi:chromosomal replication initiation ATPase DnaA